MPELSHASIDNRNNRNHRNYRNYAIGGGDMRGMQQQCVRIGSWIVIGLLLGTPAAFADDVVGQITASAGLIEGGQNGTLVDGDRISVGDEGGCSILVDDDALVELCGDTSLVLRREKNRRVVVLDRGEIRLVVEPRSFEQRVEIHTPAAIATLLGTIVHVRVAENGVTTISSAASKISVRSRDPNIRGATVIDTSEQVTVIPGQAPQARSRRLAPEQVAALGGCLVDFHSAAIGRDIAAHAASVTNRLAALDAAAFETQEFPAHPASPNWLAGDPIAAQEGVCTATECSLKSIEVDQEQGE